MTLHLLFVVLVLWFRVVATPCRDAWVQMRVFYHSYGNGYSLLQFNIIPFNLILLLFYFASILVTIGNSLRRDSVVLSKKLQHETRA